MRSLQNGEARVYDITAGFPYRTMFRNVIKNHGLVYNEDKGFFSSTFTVAGPAAQVDIFIDWVNSLGKR